MVQFIPMLISMLQSKKQQNMANDQQIAQNLQAPNVAQNANALLGSNFSQQQTPTPMNVVETEEEKRKRLFGL